MMDAVGHDPVPENGADRSLLAVEKRQRAVEILRRQLLDPGYGVLVDEFEAGRKRFDRARTLDMGWFGRHVELPRFNPLAHIGVALREVPCKLAERAASCIRAKVV